MERELRELYASMKPRNWSREAVPFPAPPPLMLCAIAVWSSICVII
jgi:hypothetical protein